MKKVKFYLQLVELCLLKMQDHVLQNYILMYVTDMDTNLSWLENEGLIGWNNEGVPYLTPKGYHLLHEENQKTEMLYHEFPDRKLIDTVLSSNEELCRRYENNDKFCEKVHYMYNKKLETSLQKVNETILNSIVHFE
jgi:hypothetical protein